MTEINSEILVGLSPPPAPTVLQFFNNYPPPANTKHF